MSDTSQLRYLRLTDQLAGFYDGRIEGYRFAPYDNWVDSGALPLGICSCAPIDGGEAIVYDTHVPELIAGPLQAGWITYYEPYEAVHRSNLAAAVPQ